MIPPLHVPASFSLDNLAREVSGLRAGDASRGARGLSLGIHTKYVETVEPTQPRVCVETGEIEGGQPDPSRKFLERWCLKQAARKLLGSKREYRAKRVRVDYTELCAPFVGPQPEGCRVTWHTRSRFFVEDLPDDLEVHALKNKFRVVSCTRDRISLSRDVEVWQRAGSHAAFHGLQACGSVWTCPTCSAKINRARRVQIRAAYDAFVHARPLISEGIHDADALMLTFTIKHGFGDECAVLFDRLKQAMRHLQASSAWKSYAGVKATSTRRAYPSPYAYVGHITATEVTHGENGWHPHLHMLGFFGRRLENREIAEIREKLFAAWCTACTKVGLPAPRESITDRDGRTHYVGVDVRRAMSADEYVTKFADDRKWGVEFELANAGGKSAKSGGKTPFQLLYEYGAHGDKVSGSMFIDYALATLGRHQLDTSKTLAAALRDLGVSMSGSDQELADQLEDDSDKLGAITQGDLDALKSSEKLGIESFGTFLHLVTYQGFDFALAWLRSLPLDRGGFQLPRSPATPARSSPSGQSGKSPA